MTIFVLLESCLHNHSKILDSKRILRKEIKKKSQKIKQNLVLCAKYIELKKH